METNQIESPEEEQQDSTEDNNFTFLDHLEELRKRIIYILIALAVCTVVAFIFIEDIYKFLIEPLNDKDLVGVKLIQYQVAERFIVFLKIAIYSGIVLSIPFLLFQISQFILPALYKKERKWYYRGLGVVIVLFIAGCIFSHQLLVPNALKFMFKFGPDFSQEQKTDPQVNFNKENDKEALLKIVDKLDEINKKLDSNYDNIRILINKSENNEKDVAVVIDSIKKTQEDISELNKNFFSQEKIKNLLTIDPNISISNYLDWLLLVILVVGIAFQLPVVLSLLAQIGLINDIQLGKFRPYAFIIILVVAAVITPPDPITQAFVGIPVYLLYEMSIIIARMIRKKKEQAEEEDLEESAT